MNVITINYLKNICTLNYKLYFLAKSTGTPTQAYTVMRYSGGDGYYRWESYWAENKPQIADVVGVSHPEV